MSLRVLDLFSGIGAYALGVERAGMKTIAFCEQDAFCQRVLAKHWPEVPCHNNVITREFHEGEADVITGGFPCQDVSLAGKRAGLSGERSGLYRELVRAIRVVRPRHAIVENVAALLSDGMGVVLGDLAESRCDAEWDCVPAAIFGAPHERDRVWIVAHVNNERCGETRAATGDVADAARAQMGRTRQSRLNGSVAHERLNSNADGDGREQGRPRRPPDSFAGIREQTRWYVADPYRARLAFRHGVGRDAWEEFAAAQRDRDPDEWQSLWPDEPALQGVDDVTPDWVDRIKATGNCNPPIIVETIARAILATHPHQEQADG